MPIGSIGNAALNLHGGVPAGAKLLGPAGFAQAVKSGRVVVEFFNYGCPYCKRAMPEVHKAAEGLAQKGVKFYMVSLGSPEAQALGGQYAPGYLPGFAVFENGQHVGSFNRLGADDVKESYIKDRVKSLLEL